MVGLLFGLSAAGAGAPSDHYQLVAAPLDRPKGLAVLLPGASGLEILGDRSHYPGIAQELRSMGYDTLLLDYKAAYAASTNVPKGTTAEKIAWVVQGAIVWVRGLGPRYGELPVTLFARSLGGEGALRILNDTRLAESCGMQRGVLFYPSCQESERLAPVRPTLAMVGDLDTVTPVAELKRRLTSGAESLLRVEVLPQAFHGFDVRSLTRRRKIREYLIVGTAHTFQFNAEAAARADVLWREFMSTPSGPHQ
jgi:dienelactone hydrolase